MPIVTPTTAEDVYDLIASEASLINAIGTLDFDGTPSLALFVVGDGDPVEGTERAAGVAVGITRNPDAKTVPLSSGGAMFERSFVIRLIQFNAETLRIQEVCEGLLRLFPGSHVSYLGAPAIRAGRSQVPDLGAPSIVAGRGQAVVRLPPNPYALRDVWPPIPAEP